ncbi:MAG: hypothetical protein IKB80_05635 [Oscillospiraceae bacterium]|nr:hypothetical protein [Oscillospiraceae bacterium]
MQCLKCGKETKNEQVFCPRCLAVMEAYPVKQDVHIQLPNHTQRELSKKSGKKRRAPSPQEQIAALRRRNRRLVAVLLAMALLLAVAGYLLARATVSSEDTELGKNYTFEIPFD